MAKKKSKSKKESIKWGNPPKNFSFVPIFILVLSGAIYYNLSRFTPTKPQISNLEEFTCESIKTKDECVLSEVCSWVNDNEGTRCLTIIR